MKNTLKNFKKIVTFILAICGGGFLSYYLYKDVLLKNSRVFKSCPYGSQQITIEINQRSSTDQFSDQLSNWMNSNKLLVRNPATNRCEKLKNFYNKKPFSDLLIKQIEDNIKIKDAIKDDYLIVNLDLDIIEKISCPKKSFIIAYFGQSNSANSVDEVSNLDIPANLYQYNWKDNSCYKYKEPLLGAQGKGGNTITAFGVSLAKNIDQNLLIIPFGIGGSLVESWSNGDLNLINKNLYKNLKKNNLNVDLFLFHQGEANSRLLKNLSKYPKNNYSKAYLKNLLILIDQTREYFPESYFGLSLVSRCADTGNKYIINSQKEVINLRRKVFISANSDSLFSKEYRYDLCHFTQEGVKALGKMYENSFKKNIFEY